MSFREACHEVAVKCAEALHRHNKKRTIIAPAVISASGGGNSFASWLLNVPGASASILGAEQPYCRSAGEMLSALSADKAPVVSGLALPAVSQVQALKMANGALARAKSLALQEAQCSASRSPAMVNATAAADPVMPEQAHEPAPFPDCVGISCTASLAAANKMGPHRAFIASVTDTQAHVCCTNLLPRSREDEDAAVSAIAIALLAEACKVPLDSLSPPPPSWLHFVATHLGVSVGCTQQADAGAAQEVSHEPQVALPQELDAIVHAQWDVAPALPRLLSSVSPGGAPVGSVLCLPPAQDTLPAVCMVQPQLPPGTVVLPGSFNPLHKGHEALAAAALGFLRTPAAKEGGGASLPHPPCGMVVYELSATNADKPPMPAAELGARLAQFVGTVLPAGVVGGEVASGAAGEAPGAWPAEHTSYRSGKHAAVLVTDAPLFVQKGALLPGAFFVLGVDTVVRLVDAKYYGGSRDSMLVQLAGLLSSKCRIVVAGRVMDKGPHAGVYLGLQDVLSDIPAPLQELFIELPQEHFRVDVSSSMLRVGHQ